MTAVDFKDHIDPPNPKMTAEERAIVDSLGGEIVNKVDEELMSHARAHNRKVQMLVMLAAAIPEFHELNLPFQFYVERVRHLVNEGRLVAEGNLDYMQYSEVRLP